MRLKITRLDPTLPLPGYGTSEAAGFDLAASHDIVVQPGQIALVRTGLVIEVPAGHFLGIFARSSTPLKRGLLVANGVGVVDPDYSGPNDEVMVQVLNFTQTEVRVQRGDRLAQGIVLPAPRVSWEEVGSHPAGRHVGDSGRQGPDFCLGLTGLWTFGLCTFADL